MATVYPFRRTAYSLPEATAKRGIPPYPDSTTSISHQQTTGSVFNRKHGCRSDKLESCLLHFEAAAREKFFEATEDLPAIKMEARFTRLLDNQVLPALSRIGFDESFARVLFQTAATGWQFMDPPAENCTRLHPVLVKDLRSVRNAILSNSGNLSGSSWYTLPRVYHFLEKEHCAYLLCYLDHLALEPSPGFRRILIRVTIEFIGNYTLKYRSSILPRCLIDSALFYGYEAMFWKSLRNPPPGYEEDLIFDHCLRWIKLMRTKCVDLDAEMEQGIKNMEAYRQKVMLTGEPFHPGGSERMDLGGLFVTLRHGDSGTGAVIRHLEKWLFSSRRDSSGRILCAMLPSALNLFLQTIKTRIPAESPEYQNALQRFLIALKEFLLSIKIEAKEPAIESPEQIQFVVQRILKLIREVPLMPAK